MAPRVQLTMLNGMAGRDIISAMDRHAALGLKWLDLKDGIFGKGVADLSDDEAAEVRRLADARGLGIWCLSTGLFFGEVESGRDAFLKAHLDPVGRVVAIARILRPRLVRLLAARTRRRDEVPDATSHLLAEHPWIFDGYREWIDSQTSAGFAVAVEN